MKQRENNECGQAFFVVLKSNFKRNRSQDFDKKSAFSGFTCALSQPKVQYEETKKSSQDAITRSH